MLEATADIESTAKSRRTGGGDLNHEFRRIGDPSLPFLVLRSGHSDALHERVSLAVCASLLDNFKDLLLLTVGSPHHELECVTERQGASHRFGLLKRILAETWLREGRRKARYWGTLSEVSSILAELDGGGWPKAHEDSRQENGGHGFWRLSAPEWRAVLPDECIAAGLPPEAAGGDGSGGCRRSGAGELHLAADRTAVVASIPENCG